MSDTSEICNKSDDTAFGIGKGQRIAVQTWSGPEVQAPRFQDNRHKNVLRLSAVPTGHLYLQENIPGTHF